MLNEMFKSRVAHGCAGTVASIAPHFLSCAQGHRETDEFQGQAEQLLSVTFDYSENSFNLGLQRRCEFIITNAMD